MILSGRLLQLLHCVLFLPGLSFWTSAIGKDGLMMVGISSFMFSLNHMSKRKKWFVFGVCLTFMVRPHVSAILLIALGLGLLVHSQFIRSKFILFLCLVAGIGAPILIKFVLSTVKVQMSSLSELANIVQILSSIIERQGQYYRAGSYVPIQEYPLLLKWFTFLYRPLFIDAKNAMMLASSCENVIYFGLSGFMFHRYSLSFFLKRKSLFFTVNVFFLVIFVGFFHCSSVI